MNALGPIAKGMAFLMGKQPEEKKHPRGFLGLEWSERSGSGRTKLQVVRVLAGSPAAQGGLRPGDRIVRIKSRAIESKQAARAALAEVRPGDDVPMVVRRGQAADAREIRLTLTAGKGL
jgi:S1-C subfamily serine protease